MKIWNIRERREMAAAAAAWFHDRWKIPEEAYRESIAACLQGGTRVPQWYIAAEGETIAGGLGVIANDFHERRDLAPNVCALYVEEAFRGQGLAGRLLARAAEDMAGLGIRRLYLVTDLASFYEKKGWTFLGMVRETGGEGQLRMYAHTCGDEAHGV